MDISPKFKMYVGAAAAVAGTLLGCGTQFTTLFGAGPANKIIAGISIASLGFGALIVYFGAFSSTQPGPLAPQDRQGSGSNIVRALLLFALLAVGLLPGAPARAAAADPLATFIGAISNLTTKGAAFVIADLTAADADAAAHKDAIADNCYKGEIVFFQNFPTLPKANSAGGVGVFQLYQYKRDVGLALSDVNLQALYTACGPLWTSDNVLAKVQAAVAALIK